MASVCGIDEAGRGPLIGPLVMAGVLVDEKGVESLRRIGVRDSKLLSHKKRLQLYDKIVAIAENHKIIILQPQEIDAALNSDSMNLNWLEATATARIINSLKPDAVKIDCPSPNVERYGSYLLNLLDDRKIESVIEHKADVNHAECSAASILAKVAREAEIAKIKKAVGDFGSGYLTDPKTIRFFEENYDRHPGIFRKAWAPYREKVFMKSQMALSDF